VTHLARVVRSELEVCRVRPARLARPVVGHGPRPPDSPDSPRPGSVLGVRVSPWASPPWWPNWWMAVEYDRPWPVSPPWRPNWWGRGRGGQLGV